MLHRLTLPLTAHEFHALADMHGTMVARGGATASANDMTLAFLPDYAGSPFGTLGVSYRAPHEPVDRPEVGMYIALTRAMHGRGCRIANPVGSSESGMVEWLADLSEYMARA